MPLNLNEHEFRERVVEDLAVLRTQMNSLVGPDGRVGTVEVKVIDLERFRQRVTGVLIVVGALVGIARFFFR